MERFFGGGAYGMKIDYASLPFPGDELGALAQEGKCPEKSPGKPNLQLATFAGGCFWGLELAFQRVEGVEFTTVGYTQGKEEYPNYDQVCAGNTGHTEAVMVYYDPEIVSYEKLLDVFFQIFAIIRSLFVSSLNFGYGNNFGMTKMLKRGSTTENFGLLLVIL